MSVEWVIEMSMKQLIALVFIVAAALVCVRLEAEPQQEGQTLRQRLLKRFDKDGDGKLSADERAAGRKLVGQYRKTNSDRRPPERMSWKVGDLEREALVYRPAKKSLTPAPLVFGFHGHGGNSRNAASSFKIHQLWPEAVVVYMQGVPTVGMLTDPKGQRTGWQHSAEQDKGRDLKFFDAVLSGLRAKYKIDNRRIYATGHSNGGGFTYLLWAHRPDVFAAIAPSAAGSRSLRTAKPKPIAVMHVAGEKDTLVRFSWQERTMQQVRTINGCDNQGSNWAKGCKLYSSPKGAVFVSFIHSGTHKYPAEAPALIVRFFKAHARPSATESAETRPGSPLKKSILPAHGRRVVGETRRGQGGRRWGVFRWGYFNALEQE